MSAPSTRPGLPDTAAGNQASTWASGKPPLVEVGTYVIETDDQRIELQDMVPIGQRGSFDLNVTVGDPVTFALEGKRTAYIRKADGHEYRLLVVKNAARTKG
jgi:hypothetical protein